jgi:MoaA/NifB/PqqE/SkfB family radical SAM enzyme
MKGAGIITKHASWQRKLVRKNIDEYRKAIEEYYIRDKKIVTMDRGYKAYSLLTPPIGSPVSKRRIKLIMRDLLSGAGAQKEQGIGAFKTKTPHFVSVAVTYDCQCACGHCSSAQYQEKTRKMKDQLSLPELKGVVDQLIDIGMTCILITGGEPLVYKDLCELLKYVDRRKCVASMFTNGEYLDETMARKLKKAGMLGVFVSLDSPDPKKHDANRARPGLFDKAVQGIKNCQEAGLLAGISTYISKEKLYNGEMDRLMELGKELGVLELFIPDIIPTGNLAGQRDCILAQEDFLSIKEFRAKYNVLSDYPRIVHQTMLTSIAYPCTGEGCPAGTAHMHVRGNGDVSPCDFTPLSFGNVRRKKLDVIWQSMLKHHLYEKPSCNCRLSDPQMWDNMSEIQAQIA